MGEEGRDGGLGQSDTEFANHLLLDKPTMVGASMNSQSGMSLLEVMMGVAILGIAAVGYARYQSNMNSAMKHYQLEGEREDVRNQLRRLMKSDACRRTINRAKPPAMPPANRCRNASGLPANRFVALYDAAGAVAVKRFTPSGNPTRIGDLEVRAYCIPRTANYEVHVEARRTDASGNALKDPLTGKLSEWAELFEDVPLTCELNEVVIGYMGAADVINRVYYGPAYVPDTPGAQFMDPDNDGGGGRQMPFNDAPARRKVCEYLGMNRVKNYAPSDYTSCGNDDVFKWNDAQKKWVLIANACAAGVNNWIGNITCVP